MNANIHMQLIEAPWSIYAPLNLPIIASDNGLLPARRPISPDFDWLEYFLLYIIQSNYGSPYCVTSSSMSTDPRYLNPGTRRGTAYPGGGFPGCVRLLEQVTHFWPNILNLYCSTCLYLFWHPIVQLFSFCVGERSWVTTERRGLRSSVPHTTRYYYTYHYFCIHWYTAGSKYRFQQVYGDSHLDCALTTCYQYTDVVQYRVVWSLIFCKKIFHWLRLRVTGFVTQYSPKAPSHLLI